MGPIEAINGLFKPHIWIVIEQPNGIGYAINTSEITHDLQSTTLEDSIIETEAWMLTTHASVRILTQWLIGPGTARTIFVM